MMRRQDEFLDAVRRGDAQTVSDLLRSQPELTRFADEYAKTGLHWAAETNQLETARVLLDAGTDIEAVTTWGATPLDWAATMGSASVAELLLDRGASGFTIVVAAALGKLEDVKRMFESEAYKSILSDAMYAAARNGHTEVVEYLLDHGATIDVKGIFGATGLHWAAINGHRNTVELLITRGATLNIRDERFDGTPQDWANEGGHAEIAELLRTPGNPK